MPLSLMMDRGQVEKGWLGQFSEMLRQWESGHVPTSRLFGNWLGRFPLGDKPVYQDLRRGPPLHRQSEFSQNLLGTLFVSVENFRIAWGSHSIFRPGNYTAVRPHR